jgi:hypothetical protein
MLERVKDSLHSYKPLEENELHGITFTKSNQLSLLSDTPI